MKKTDSRTRMPRWALWLSLIVIWVSLAGFLAFAVIKATATRDVYRATAILFVQRSNDPELYPSSEHNVPSEDYAALVEQSAVLEQVIPQVPPDSYTVEDLQKIIHVKCDKKANLIEISATHWRPSRASWIAQRTAESFVSWYRTSLIDQANRCLSIADNMMAQLEPNTNRTAEEENWLSQVVYLRAAWSAELSRDTAEAPITIQQPANWPEHPLGKHTSRNIALACLGGLVVAIGIALFIEYRGRRARPARMLEQPAGKGLSVVHTMRSRLADGEKEQATKQEEEEEEEQAPGLPPRQRKSFRDRFKR